MIYATFLVPSTISSHVPFRRQIDRSLLEGSPLASVARSSQGGNTGEIHEETWSTCFLTSSLLPFHICSSAKDGQRENKRVNINTSLRFSRLLLSPLPSPVSLPKFPFTLFFFFTRVRPNGPREGWKTERGGVEEGGEGRKGVRKYTKRKAKRANFIWTRGGGKVHGEYHNAPAVPPFENRAETGRKL